MSAEQDDGVRDLKRAVDALAQLLAARHGPWAGRLIRRFVDALDSPSKVALIAEADGLQQLHLTPPVRLNAQICDRCRHNAAAHEGTRGGDRCHFPACNCPGFHTPA